MYPSDEDIASLRETLRRGRESAFIASAEAPVFWSYVISTAGCSHCRAPIDEPCVNSITGYPTTAPHPHRVKAAR